MLGNSSTITIRHYDFLCEDAKYIREEVFIKEQGFKEEFDELDNKVSHIVLFSDEEAVGTGRLIPKSDETFAIGRVAVLKKYRKLHLGRKIINELENMAENLGGKAIELSAQCRAQGFYEKLGYIAKGQPYLDESCEHIHMEKQL